MNETRKLYDEHPINEQEILSKLEQSGKELDSLRPEDLSNFDQDHYGGLEATDLLAERLRLHAGDRVLDICSGLGGTSRYLAYRHGCEVVGVDLHRPRTESAIALTRRVGLEERVTFVCGDAARLEFPDGSFDAAISQEAFLHITDKEGLFAGCRRVLKPGGRLGFTDWIAHGELGEEESRILREVIAAVALSGADRYRACLEKAGFTDIRYEDLSEWWRGILRGRLEMFKSLKKETVRRFGEQRHNEYIAAYTIFVERIESGVLGGGRFCAVA